jgi:hypothetical protein
MLVMQSLLHHRASLNPLQETANNTGQSLPLAMSMFTPKQGQARVIFLSGIGTLGCDMELPVGKSVASLTTSASTE